jgi:magnesium transporter
MSLFKKTSKLSNHFKTHRKVGASPGALHYVGRERKEKVKIEVIDYTGDKHEKKIFKNAKDCAAYRDSRTVTWINVTGVHNTEIIEELGKIFSIHPLTQEDITNTTQRPKVEEYENYLFTVFKMVYMNRIDGEIITEQVSLIVGKNFVISFQEKEGDILEPLRNRIEIGKGKIRELGSDYLAYTIADLIADYYFVILEHLSEEIEKIEEKLLRHTTPTTLNSIYRLKRELIILRKSVWPMREVISNLERGEYDLITKEVKLYLRDVYDHTIQAVETIETFRDMVSGMLDLYLSNNSNRMNEVMKVLTIFASIFIPLTFIAGVYGMNFEYMPELKWPWGYYGILLIMFSVVLGMLYYFKRKKWL